MVGASQVFPGVQPTPADIAALIESERVTVTAGVPTVLLGILQEMEKKPYDLSSLRAVPCGGSAVPESLIAAYDALGVNVERMTIFGLFISNSMIGLAGALLAQYQGFADVQMGIGMLVWGVASVILGESLVGTKRIGYLIAGAIMGSVLFRLLIAIALRWGLNPNDLKLITAVFVFVALVLPKLLLGGSSRLLGRAGRA